MRMLFIFCDMLRADRLKTFTPRLSEEGLMDAWFRRLGGTCYVNAYTPAPETSRSLACLYTGLYPAKNGCRFYSQYPRYWLQPKSHLFRILGEHGYENIIYTPPIDYIRGNFPPDILDCHAKIYVDFSKALDAIRENKTAKQMVFLTLDDYHTAVDMAGRHISGDYEGQRHLSGAFERLFQQIAIDEFDKIVIFSDHGCILDIDAQTELDWMNDCRTRIVLFIHQKGESQMVRENKVVTIMDIYPTLLQWLELEYDETIVDGRSLLQPKEDRFVVMESDIFHKSSENYLQSVMDIWVYRDLHYRFTQTLAHGFRLQKVTENGYVESLPDKRLLADFRKKIALYSCFYKYNQKAWEEIPNLIKVAKKTKNLWADPMFDIAKNNAYAKGYDSNGYATHYNDGQPILTETNDFWNLLSRIPTPSLHQSFQTLQTTATKTWKSIRHIIYQCWMYLLKE